MKKRSPFDLLNQAQKEKILELCENLPYEEVVQVLALPGNMGGFDLRTSYSSVRRFYVKNHPDLRDYDTVGRHAEALQIAYEKSDGAVGTAIVALIEAKIYASLKRGASVSHVDKDLRVLSTVQRTQLSLAKWRLAHPETATAKAAEFDKSCVDEDQALQALAEGPSQAAAAPDPAKTESEIVSILASPASIPRPLPADASAVSLAAPSSPPSPLPKPVQPVAPERSAVAPAPSTPPVKQPRSEPRPLPTAAPASEVPLAGARDSSSDPSAAAPTSPDHPESSAPNTPKTPVKPHYPQNPQPSSSASSPHYSDAGAAFPRRRRAMEL